MTLSEVISRHRDEFNRYDQFIVIALNGRSKYYTNLNTLTTNDVLMRADYVNCYGAHSLLGNGDTLTFLVK